MKNCKIFLVMSLPAAALFLPSLAFAAFVTCTGTAESPCNFDALIKMVNTIINWFIGVSASIAAITFSIAGAKMLFNPGNAAKREEALGMFKKTVLGMIIILSAWLVIHTIIKFLAPDALTFIG